MRLSEQNAMAIAELLVGQKVEKIDDATLRLSNGVRLRLRGNDGGCSCGSGDYELTELNGVDNVVTKVELLNEPDDNQGVYRIFVYADNVKVNLATFVGSDGDGSWYGTGYSIEVEAP